ncbi:hypothetical protein H0H92_000946 [Tricholoma furcatifolium]|nr:hypothetical protein H0H92_000946 [Tricholoma furcatifolium]
MSKHHPDLIMCRRQPGIGSSSVNFAKWFSCLKISPPKAIGRLCEKCDGKWYETRHLLYKATSNGYSFSAPSVIPTFDQRRWYAYATNVTSELMEVDVSYVVHLVRLLYLLSVTTSHLPGISDAYYCAECTRLEKDRDGCPKIVNLGASRTDLFYERRRLGALSSVAL